MTTLLEVRDLSVAYGASLVVDSVSLHLEAGCITGLVGPNGAGKTTLIEALSGFVPVSSGTIRLDGVAIDHLPPHRRARLGLGRTFQSLELFEDLTVEENLAVATGGPSAGVELDPNIFELAAVMAVRPSGLSHDERSRVALARALAGRPTVLLLDEPAAGLDPAHRSVLAAHLRSLAADGMAVLLVEHDLGLVSEVCDRVYVLDAGRVVADGPAGGPTPTLAEEDADCVPNAEKSGVPNADTSGTPTGTPTGAPALEVRGLAVSYGRVPAVHDATLSVAGGEVAALVGPNGAGKSTTLRAIAGALRPTSGTIRILGVEMAGRRAHHVAREGVTLVPQERPVFDTLTVAENLALAGRRRREGNRVVEAAVALVPELGPLLDRSASRLSGGERRLLALARAVASEPAVLLVDELSLGLAPPAAERVRAMVARVAATGTAVLVVDQQPRVQEGLAPFTYVMERGRIVGDR